MLIACGGPSGPRIGPSVRPPDAHVAAARRVVARYQNVNVNEGDLLLQSATTLETPLTGFSLVFEFVGKGLTTELYTGTIGQEIVVCTINRGL